MNVFFRGVNAFVALLAMILALLSPQPLLANDHGGGGAPEPMVFTVNLGTESYVQFGLIFEGKTPEVEHLLASYKPKIQHEIILLLSGKDAATLRTLAGKKALIAEIIKLGNHAIHEDEESGIKDVLFTKFLIQ